MSGLTKRDIDVIVFSLNYLRSNLHEVQEAYSEPGVHPTVSIPVENELDNICAKLERKENG